MPSSMWPEQCAAVAGWQRRAHAGSSDRALGVARKVESGTVWINDGLLLNNRFAFSGWKKSGLGVELGKWGFEEFPRLKHIHVGQHAGSDEKYYYAIVLGEEF